MRRHIYAYNHQYALVPHTSHADESNNNNSHSQATTTDIIDNSLIAMHQQKESERQQHTDVQSYCQAKCKLGHPTCLSQEDEQIIVQYINEMGKINLPLSKQQVIITASDFATQLGIKIKSKTGLLSKNWWTGNTNQHIHM